MTASVTDRAPDASVRLLHGAVKALIRSGITSPVLIAAAEADCWSPAVTVRAWEELQRFAAELPDVGIDPALLPVPPHPPVTSQSPQNGTAHDVQIPESVPELSAAATLAVASPKPNLEFEGTLDGLRGVPVDDLAGIRGDAGVNDNELERLTAAGITSVFDLMLRIPLRYIDRSEITPLPQLRPGMKNVATIGKVMSTKADWGKKYARIQVGAGQHRVTTMQFQAPWMANRFKSGDLVLLWGDVTEWQGHVQMPGALIAPMRDATVPFVPVYPQSDKHQVSTWTLARAALDALRRIPHLDDPVPEKIRATRQFPSRLDALRAVHIPESTLAATAGRDRLAYDELFRMQLAMGVQRNAQRQRPAITHKPTGSLTRAWLASLPWQLTGAQRRCLTEIADDLRADQPMKRLLQGDVGSGKAQPLDALVLTPAGYIQMGDIEVGDAVVNPTGNITTVTGVYPQGQRPVFRVHLSDGTFVRADGEHLWAVRTSVMRHKDREPKIMTTNEISADLMEKNGAHKWHIELAEPVELDDSGPRPLDGYLLGVLLGDGSIKQDSAKVTTGDPEMIDLLTECLPDRTEIRATIYPDRPTVINLSIASRTLPALARSIDVESLATVRKLQEEGYSVARIAAAAGITSGSLAQRLQRAGFRCAKRTNPALTALHELGLTGKGAAEKFVPSAYLNAPIKVRHAVLQGLLDTDGTLDYRTGVNISFSTISARLANDVAWLSRSLGGVATVRHRVRRSGNSWHVGVTLPNEFEPFRLQRKAMWVHARSKYRYPARAITAIEPDGTEPVQCIAVAHPNHLYVTDNFTPTHNTKVALGAMLMAVESGHQAALMAPIGVLVQQHYEEVVETCEQLGIRAVLVPGTGKVKARREALSGLASGEIHIAIGTTGLLSDDVVFKSLGLAVIDEQHRFGVEQRAALLAKAPGDAVADELGATATPIPRTAAMTVFGDTDISILDELPPGRTPIATKWLHEVALDNPAHSHWRFVRAQIDSGRQAFVVCPLVAEPETKTGQESEAQSAAAIETAEALATGALSGQRIGVVTGRQKPVERAEVMGAFVGGDIDVLVATTVIEVGVSVPNATTITILDAARFGLAQLHQLRGRVGRGAHPGYCILTGDASATGQARLDAMCATTDGFKLANVDLELRGPGALAGTAQAGHRAGLLVADLLADANLMHAARADAAALLLTDPNLARRPTLRAEVERALGADARYLQRS